MKQQLKSLSPGDIVALTLFGLITGLSFLGFSLVLVTSESGLGFADASLCLGPFLAGLGGVVLTWFRNRARQFSLPIISALVLWFLGANILGLGLFGITAISNDQPIMTDLGITSVICFLPAGFTLLLGVALYIYEYRQTSQEQDKEGLEVKTTANVNFENDSISEPATLTTRDQKLARAAAYRKQIIILINQKQGTVFADYLNPITAQLETWENRLHYLVERINDFENDAIIQSDLTTLPDMISALETRLAEEESSELHREIEETLTKQRQHQTQLLKLITAIQRADLDIDETLAAMGTIYTQLQTLEAMDLDSSKAKSVSVEITEEVEHLNDLLAAMEETYAQDKFNQG